MEDRSSLRYMTRSSHIPHVAQGPRLVLSTVRNELEKERLIPLNPPVALFQRPVMVHLLKLEAEVVGCDDPATAGVELDGVAESRADFVFAWHKTTPSNYCIYTQ